MAAVRDDHPPVRHRPHRASDRAATRGADHEDRSAHLPGRRRRSAGSPRPSTASGPHSDSTATSRSAGVAALILSGGLLGISGSFFWFVSRRIDPRPEDRADAEIAEAAGELGFFSPGQLLAARRSPAPPPLTGARARVRPGLAGDRRRGRAAVHRRRPAVRVLLGGRRPAAALIDACSARISTP